MPRPQLNPDLLEESPYPLMEIVNHIPQLKSASQIRGWIYAGIVPYSYRHLSSDTEKPRVYLECIYLPEGLATSIAAYQRFIRRINDAEVPPAPSSP
mgnify:FL=1